MAKKLDIKKRRTTGLLEDTQGLTTVEYIIILCLIACVGFGVWKKFGNTVKTKVGEAETTLDTEMSGTMEEPGAP